MQRAAVIPRNQLNGGAVRERVKRADPWGDESFSSLSFSFRPSPGHGSRRPRMHGLDPMLRDCSIRKCASPIFGDASAMHACPGGVSRRSQCVVPRLCRGHLRPRGSLRSPPRAVACSLTRTMWRSPLPAGGASRMRWRSGDGPTRVSTAGENAARFRQAGADLGGLSRGARSARCAAARLTKAYPRWREGQTSRSA